MMNKFLASSASLAVLIGAMSTASAKEGDFSGYFSVGQGALYDTYAGGFSNAGPFNLEAMVGKEIMQGIEVNAGFMFGIDTQDSSLRGQGEVGAGSTAVRASAKYLGIRPGVRLFLGDDRGQHHGGYIRPYLRAAFPIDVSLQTDPSSGASRTYVNVGLLVGGGLEYRWKHVGVFGEVIVVPFFRDFYMPIEGRVGVAVHF